MGDQMLAELAAAAEHHDQLAGQHRCSGQPLAQLRLHLGQPVQAGQGEVGIRGLGDQLDQVGRIECVEMPAVEQTLGGPGVDETAPGQRALRRLDPNHTLMLRRGYRPSLRRR